MTFPAAGSAADLALLLCDHHGASLIVTAGHTASIEEFFDRTRQQSNPSTFLTRLKVGEKLVDAKAVATLYRSRVSGGAIALLVLAMLIAVIVALWVSRADAAVLDWVTDYWNQFSLWVQGLVVSLGSREARDFPALARDLAGRGLPRPGHRRRAGFRVCCPTRCCRVCATTRHELQNQINGLTDDKNALNEKLSAAGDFDAQMSPRILRDALTGKSVVLFRTPDAADDDVEARDAAGRRRPAAR